MRTTVADMPADEFKAYKARLQRERRARLKQAADDGAIRCDAETTREALADAALMLLATGAPGSEAVEAYLGRVFASQPGAVMTLRARARSGEIKPRLLRHVAERS